MLVYVLIAVACGALWLFALIDAIRVPERAWARTGRNKTVWVVLLVSFAGTVVYLTLVRRSIHAAERHIQKKASAAERRFQKVRDGTARS